MDKDLTAPAKTLIRRARRQMWFETYAPVLAAGVLSVSLYMALAAFGVWQRLGDPWRAIALSVSGFFLVRSVFKAVRLSPPSYNQAKRRVETDNALSHRPLDTLVDKPAKANQDNPSGQSPLWDTHVKSAQNALNTARPTKQKPSLAPIDRYYLRYITPVFVVLAVMVGAGDNYERMRASILPKWMSGISANNASFEAWIDPPKYTNRPPSYFKNTMQASAPEGSKFVVRINGVKTAPRLLVHDGKTTKRISPKRLGPKSFEASAVLDKPARASFRIGSMTKTWKIDVGKDNPPFIQFEDKPKDGKRDKLIFSYNLQDDFGVKALYLSVALATDPETKVQIPVDLTGRAVRKAKKEVASLDLTKHKWAGKKVIGRLLAVDGKNQVGSTVSANFVIPEKIFVEPLAKAVAENRTLVMNANGEYAPLPRAQSQPDAVKAPMFAVDRPDLAIERAPEQIQRAALLLEAITDQPAGVFDDPAVYMGLRTIHKRLQLARSAETLNGLEDELWTIALRAEFGILGDALFEMQAAERALNNAMARRAPQREIDVLFERYNQAVERYMEELTKKAIEEAKNRAGEDNSSGEGADFNTDQIQELLDAIEEANRMGDTVAARKALAKLAQLLEHMKIQLGQGGSGNGSNQSNMSEELKQALEELNELLGEQRELRDETREKGLEEADKNDPMSGMGDSDGGDKGDKNTGPSKEQLAEQQAKLRDMLEKLEQGSVPGLDELGPDEQGQGGQGREEMGENGGAGADKDGKRKTGGGGLSLDEALKNEAVQEALKDAKRAMRESEDALKNGDLFGAGQEQSDAIKALRDAGEALFEQEAKRLAEENKMKKSGQDGEGRDPLGRENGAGGIGDDVKVPEIDDRQRAYELLQELRRRSGEQDRDKIERDYLDRLLEQF